jgi:hypothetical protein
LPAGPHARTLPTLSLLSTNLKQWFTVAAVNVLSWLDLPFYKVRFVLSNKAYLSFIWNRFLVNLTVLQVFRFRLFFWLVKLYQKPKIKFLRPSSGSGGSGA